MDERDAYRQRADAALDYAGQLQEQLRMTEAQRDVLIMELEICSDMMKNGAGVLASLMTLCQRRSVVSTQEILEIIERRPA